MEFSEIGYFSKVHGVKGHLVVKVEVDFDEDLVKAFFVEQAGNKAPYFISELKDTPNGLIVVLEEVDAVEKAKLLVGKKVFVDSACILDTEPEENWVGYELIDAQFGSLGKIESMSNNGLQDLVHLRVRGKEVLLPLVEAFVKEINEETGIINYAAPEGLIEVYLEDGGASEPEK